MFDTMTRWLAGVPDVKGRQAIREPLKAVVDRMSTQSITTPTVVISSGGATTAKIGAVDYYAVVQGGLVTIAAGTALPALTGITAAQNAFVIVCFFVDAAGVVTVLGGAPNATLYKAGWPAFPQGKCLIAMALIKNTGGVFTGGTTALDTATTVYFNGTDIDPSALV